MNIDIELYIKDGKNKIENYFQDLYQDSKIPENLKASMKYSLLAGGKRLRPILLFASFHSFCNRDDEKLLRIASALEMIHTYSLIHDDLPAMDDDDYRRGALTNHKKFDEATAILAGDALLTNSFELVATDDLLTNEEKVFILKELSRASGPEGMVAGQILDMEGESKQLTVEQLEEIHAKKTGKLITFAIIAGAYLAKVSDEQMKNLYDFAYYLGIIFQVQDDILDIIGDAEKLGKPVGSDLENDKSTYPNLLGLDGAKQLLDSYTNKALKALEAANVDHKYLEQLLYYFGQRDH